MGREENSRDVGNNIWPSESLHDQWIALPVTGPRPSARYKHAAAVVDEKLYIVGGSRNGRYLSDVQVFDFRGLAWSNLELKVNPNAQTSEVGSVPREILPATSGHSMLRWEDKLFLIGGNSRKLSDKISVWFINMETSVCGMVETSGNVPISRAGHSVSLVGSRVIMFGGEDRTRRLLNDVHFLDLETMTWESIEAKQNPPAPRFDHTSAVHADHYLLVFGGCSHSIFFNDLHVLDLETMEWSQPQLQGDLVTPRAGHAGIAIDEKWFIVGGGDNRTGCTETVLLDMSKLVFSTLASVNHRDPLASEGLSVCSLEMDGEKHLVAFGGYNGKYSNEVFVMKTRPRDSSRRKILQSPAAAAAAASVTAAYALAVTEKLDSMATEVSSSGERKNSVPQQDIVADVEAIKQEKATLELSLVEVRAENSRLAADISELNSTHAELFKELQSVQGQLVAERSRCFNLEEQIAALRKVLESMPSIEKEVEVLRRLRSALEQDTKLASSERQVSGGVWRWIAGGNGDE